MMPAERRISCLVVVPFLLLAAPRVAGQEASGQAKVKVEARVGVVAGEHLELPPETIATMELGLDFPTIKGHSFRAEMVVETSRKLADGNSVQRTSKAVVYRDQNGRVREERTIHASANPEQQSREETTILIRDPEKRIHYFLIPKLKVGFRTQLPEVLVRNDVRRTTPWTPEPHHKATSLPLGFQMIEGLQVEGKLETVSVPPGTIGNSYPMEIATERWYCAELQINLIVKRIDPRSGETTIRLMSLSLEEPAESLFEIPKDYEIRESTTTQVPMGGKEQPIRRPL